MSDPLEVFVRLTGASGPCAGWMPTYAQWLAPHVPEITDRFYERLLAEPETSQILNGRVDALKATHNAWLRDLPGGHYDDAFYTRQKQIGKTHVIAKIPPLFVAASFSILRALIFQRLQSELENREVEDQGHKCTRALGRLLDTCQFLIDQAYEEDRMERLSSASGLSRPLLENLISLRQR